MIIDVICRGKMSWIVQDILTNEQNEFVFFDDTMNEYKNTKESTNQNVFVANGDPYFRKEYYDFYKDRTHVKFISNTAAVSKYAKVQDAAFLNNYCSVGALAEIGFASWVHAFSNIDVGTKLGDYCRVGSNVHIAEYVTIGDCVVIGSGSVIVPRVSIGNNCRICAGTIVTKSFGDNLVLAGSPARAIKKNIEE